MVSSPLNFRAKDSVDHGKNEPSASTKEIDDKGKAAPDISQATASNEQIDEKDKTAPDSSQAMVVLPFKQSVVADPNVVTQEIPVGSQSTPPPLPKQGNLKKTHTLERPKSLSDGGSGSSHSLSDPVWNKPPPKKRSKRSKKVRGSKAQTKKERLPASTPPGMAPRIARKKTRPKVKTSDATAEPPPSSTAETKTPLPADTKQKPKVVKPEEKAVGDLTRPIPKKKERPKGKKSEPAKEPVSSSTAKIDQNPALGSPTGSPTAVTSPRTPDAEAKSKSRALP